MSSSALAACLRHLRGKLAAQQHSDNSDEQLLHAFSAQREESAFAALVHRHGPMVLHVCRRVLRHDHDAEDAFQATFLVLARRATTLRKKASVVSFLHGIAYRTALKAKQSAARRRKHEGQAPSRVPANPVEELSWREVRALLDEEIARLPEIYRSVFILCVLEDRSRAEAAQRLGLNENTLSSRLAKARKRLGQRLARRGVELTAVLATSMLATQSASALPAVLASSTIQAALGDGTVGVVSAHIAGLAKGTAVPAHTSKIVICLALAAGAAAVGAGILVHHEPADAPRTEAPKVADKKPADTVTMRGRVLDPDGKPVQGSRLYWPRVPKTEPKSAEDIEIPQRAETDAEGRFLFELPRSDIKPEWRLALIAAADGYGVAWAEWSAIAKGGELTLRLVKDQPIEGRVLTMEGKPLADVRVSIDINSGLSAGKVDAFVSAWKRGWRDAQFHHVYYENGKPPPILLLHKILKPATTDKDGHFRFVGAGSERLVVLRVRGSRIVPGTLYIINRAGFDAAPVNKAVLDPLPVELRLPGNPPLLYGPKLTYVVPASRRIEGTVREAGSGKPVAGYRINGAVSDKEGRYQLSGIPKMKQYLLYAGPPAGSSWLPTEARINDTPGLQPLRVDFTVAHGPLLTGRVRDQSTGKAVAGLLYFVPLPGNKFAGKPGYDLGKYQGDVGTDGRFKLAVIPGPGVLMFEAEKLNDGRLLNPYKQAEFDDKDREHVKAINEAGNMNAVKYLDLAADGEKATCDLFVDRGLTRMVKIEDPDGKPLKGTMVAGVTACWPFTFRIKETTCTVFALDPKKPRRLLFYHAERNLAESLTVRGDEKGPLIVRLRPTGSVSGRVLDQEGQPLAGADVNLAPQDSLLVEIYRQLDQRGQVRQVVHTSEDGSYRLDGIVPDMKFNLIVVQGRRFLTRRGVWKVKPGETLNLGDVRVKPGP